LSLILQDTHVEESFGKVGLQAEGLREFCFCLLRVRLLHQHRAQVVVQLSSLRLKLDRSAKLDDRAIKVFREIKYPPQGPMRFRIAGRQTCSLLRLAKCACQISFADERVCQIYVRLLK